MRQKRSLFLVLALVAVIGAIWSFMILNTARRSANETLDQRVQDVASQLKCPICQGESVADARGHSPATASGQVGATGRPVFR